MSVPSRAFLIQQSVLNAIATRYPHTLHTEGLIAAAKEFARHTGCDAVADLKREWVRKEYSLLAARYQERNAA